MVLSERLKMNVSLVEEGAGVADIGCDHGYASIYLAEKKGCRCIATDVREGPLNMARDNIFRAGMEKQIQCRLCDGLGGLKPGEVDTLLLGGMGGMLICDILSACLEVTDAAETLILQPQSDCQEVRRRLHGLGFRIDEELCCEDRGKFYLALRAKKGYEKVPYSEREYQFGRILAVKRDVCYRKYLMLEEEKQRQILEKLQKKRTENMTARIQDLLHKMKGIQKTLAQYDKEGR